MPRTAISGRVAMTRFITSPTAIADLTAWYRADSGITIATGVSQWDDGSGNDYHLLQATGSKQPLFVASAVNGQPAVRFDGVNDFMKATFTLAQPTTVIIVYKSVSIGAVATNDIVFDGSTFAAMMMLSYNNGPAYSMYAGAQSPIVAAAVADGVYAYVEAHYSGTGSLIRVNGTQTGAGDPGTGTAGGLSLGGAGNESRFSNVEVAEVMIFPAKTFAW